MQKQSRIELTDTTFDMLHKLTEGNPGAMRVAITLMGDAERVDPENAFGKYGPLISLDSNGIYGADIWMLFKDVCGESTLNVHTLMRAMQLGLIDHTTARQSIDAGKLVGDKSFEDLLTLVRNALPTFAQPQP